ncbi:MAG TPA: hypothetical protein PKI11_19195 [Candidatus Hydrogenedentes bacterium]|nr:hypothetical protein [Candidatus Hydrogenedentota bacterium]
MSHPEIEEALPSDRSGKPGDSIGARRIRHAFRFAVLACVVATLTLWFAENYLRYPKPERLYRMALLHEDDSARALLRNLVPKDDEIPQDPRFGTYLAALAFIEDGTWERQRQGIYESYAVDPLVIERYEQALGADKENPFILTLFGCALFLDGQYTRARDVFRDARRFTPAEDALPAYLEAAARAHLGEMGEALSLIRQTSGNPAMRIHIPEPLWHPSLPRQGMWYAHVQRRLTERVLAPLVALKNLVCSRAGRHAPESPAPNTPTQDAGGGAQPAFDKEAWLQEVETLGRRLLAVPPSATGAGAAQVDATVGESIARTLTTLQARLSLTFQQEALRLRLQSVSLPAADREAARRRLQLIEDAQAQLQAFDETRSERVLQHAVVVNRPGVLCFQTLAACLAAYALAYLLGKLLHAGRTAWAVPHPSWVLASLGAVFLLLLLILLTLLLIGSVTRQPGAWLDGCSYAWYGLVASLMLAGLAYPRLLLRRATTGPSPSHDSAPEPPSRTASPAVRGDTRAYAGMLRRYYGMLAATFLVFLCVYAIAHRLITGLYPFIHAKLLISGLQQEELDLVLRVRFLLDGAMF